MRRVLLTLLFLLPALTLALPAQAQEQELRAIRLADGRIAEDERVPVKRGVA